LKRDGNIGLGELIEMRGGCVEYFLKEKKSMRINYIHHIQFCLEIQISDVRVRRHHPRKGVQG